MSTAAPQPSGCPRCAVKLDRPYKYCPNCSYRLRPDLVRHHPTGAEPIRQSQRLLAIGGYLGFVSLLLLLVLTGLRLFESDPMPPEDPLRRVNVAVSNVEFGPGDLHPVSAGEVSWGEYRPVDSTGVYRDLLRRMPAGNSVDDDPENADLKRWVEEFDAWASRMRSILEEQTRALLPELYRVDDPFSMGVAEITNEQWYAFLHARAKKSGKPTPADYYPTSWTRPAPDRMIPRIYPAAAPGKPVSDISYLAALEFCNWVWEEILGADPDVVVDLPTALEFARAGRDNSLNNFPWGRTLGDLDPDDKHQQLNLSGLALPTRAPEVGLFRGLYGQVGNVAEWIHVQSGGAAAGWSYIGSPRSYATDRGEAVSPFSSEELEVYPDLSDRAPHIGFRIAVRRAPSLPEFVPVTAGPVQFVPRTNPVMPPRVEILDPVSREFDTQQHPVEMPARSPPIARSFAIANNEITNRQYLAYLVEEAPRLTAGYLPDDSAAERAVKTKALQKQRMELLPRRLFWGRAHPFAGRELVFAGQCGRGDSISRLFEAGQGSHPVQGVSPMQAQAYAKWLSRKLGARVRLPTAAEFVRAGRGGATTPYPWGESTGKWELICEGRADDQDRARSLYSFLREAPGSIQGLCGNVLELVEAPPGVIREQSGGTTDAKDWLLAGGCYEFSAEGCTLDSFLDQGWNEAELEMEVEPGEEGTALPSFEPVLLAELTGFRVIREAPGR